MTKKYCRHCNERLVTDKHGDLAALGKLHNPDHGNPYTCTNDEHAER